MAHNTYYRNISPEVVKQAINFIEPDHDVDKIISKLDEFLEKNPEDYSARFWLALCYYHDLFEYQLAGKALPLVIRLENEPTEMLLLRLGIDKELNQLEIKQKQEIATRAVENSPDWVNTHRELAIVYENLGDYTRALNEIKIALDIKHNQDENIDRSDDEINEHYYEVITGNGSVVVELLLERLKSQIVRKMKAGK